MASDLEKIGLQAVLLTDQWVKGMNEYVSGLHTMEADTEKAADATAKSTEQMAQRQEAALREVGLAFAAVGAAGIALLTSVTMYASRTEELGVILDVTAENARRMAEAEGDHRRASELSAEAVQEQVDAVRALHLSNQVAAQVVAQLIRYNLDWKKSTDLARLAQDAATFAAQDSSQALEGLIHGITTLNPRVLRTYGILVSLEQEYAKFAETTGRTVESISQQEKQQIAFNAVLAQAPNIAGAYEAAMDTASKQIRSLTTDIADVSDEFGEHFTPYLTDAVGALRDLLHWLAELPDPIQATAVQVLAIGSGLSAMTGAILGAIPLIKRLKESLLELKIVQILVAEGLLGPVGIIAGLTAAIGVLALYAHNIEQAHRQEAASIAETADSYQEYLALIHQAELDNYALSESLYEVAHAAQEAGAAFDALALQQAREEIKDLIELNLRFAESESYVARANGEATTAQELFLDAMVKAVAQMSETELAVVGNREELLNLAIQLGLSADEALAFADAMLEAATKARLVADFMRGVTGEALEPWQEMAETSGGIADGMDRIASAAQRLAEEYGELADAAREFREQADEALLGAAKKMIEAEQDAVDKRLGAREKFLEEATDLEQEHAEKVEDILQELARVDADLAADRLQAEEDYQRDRADLADEYAQDILDAEEELSQKREDLARDLAHDLEDLERKHAQDVEDLDRDLARDLEDLQRDHLQDMADMERDYYSDLEDLTREYNERREEAERDYYESLEDLTRDYNKRRERIEEAFAKKRAEIEGRYNEEKGDLFEDYLSQLQEVAGKYTDVDWLKELLLGAGEGGYIPPQFKELIDAYLEELGKLQDERDEDLEDAEGSRDEDLSDLEEWLKEEQEERQRAYDEELAALEEWLAKEQEERQRAYEEERARAEEEYQRKRDERQRQYAQDREDLERKLAQEREELARDNQRRQEDLQRQHERERAETERRYQERLDALDRQLAEEQKRLEERAEADRARLQAQLEEERQHYDERRQQMVDAYADELRDIDEALAERQEEIQESLRDELVDIVEALADENEAFREAYRIRLEDLKAYDAERRRIEQEYQDWLAALYGIGSPSRWAIEFGRNIRRGMEIGIEPASLAVDLSGAMEKFQGAAASVEVQPRAPEADLFARAAQSARVPDLGPGIDRMVQAIEGLEVASPEGDWGAGLDRLATALTRQPAITPPEVSLTAPATQVYQPPAIALPSPVSNVTSTQTNQFDLTANYARGQSEASLRDDILALQMMMAASTRRRR
jgi:hypothetical protein